MKLCAILIIVYALAMPAGAAVVHDESVNGDLATDPGNPTSLVFVVGGNTIIGTVSNPGVAERDYIRFTIDAGQTLSALNLIVFDPDNIAFAAFNAGTTSYVPSVATDANFLAGIHASGANEGANILPQFVCCAVTTNSLPAAELGPGDYCFLIQQTSNLTTSYSLEFVVTSDVAADGPTWGAIKALYK